jgi:hypothetical protein
MRKLVSVFAVIFVLVSGAVYAKNLSVDMDLIKPDVATKEAEADEWLNKGNAA